jgi:hypothetical protein
MYILLERGNFKLQKKYKKLLNRILNKEINLYN